MNLPVISYVREYFELYFNTYYTKLSKREVNSIIYGIGEKINDKYSLSQVREGSADNLIQTIISAYVKENFPALFSLHNELKPKVTKVIESHYHVTCSIKTFDLIVEKVLSTLLKIYGGYNPIMGDDNYENKICFCYQQVVEHLCNAMMQYVMSQIEKYLNKSDPPLLYVDKENVAMTIVKEVMAMNKINAVSLLTGGCSKIIEEYVKENNKENEIKRMQQRQAISSKYNSVEPKQEQIFSVNMEPTVFRANNHEILDNVNRMKEASVNSKGKPNKIKKVGKRRKITKAISTLLLLVTLLNVGSGIANKVIENVNENNAISRYENFNDFNYSQYYYSDEQRYDSMANYVISYYFQVEELGNEHFNSLGFYNLLHSGKVTDEELDIVLRLVQEKISERDDCAELEGIFLDNLSYLDFIYGRLVAMGCEEIKEEKYQKAILAYKQSNFANRYGIPADNLYQYEKDLIQEIKELYEKYNRDYMIELGEMIEFDGYRYYLDYDSGTKGRQV